MVEVKLHRLTVRLELLHRTGVLALSVRRGELHHIPNPVLLMRVTEFVEKFTGHPLQQIRVALTKGLARR